MHSYLEALAQSLAQKEALLEILGDLSREQAEALQADSMDLEAFDALVEQKDGLIGELTKLDQGFESLYGRIKSELEANPVPYKAAVADLQASISRIMEKSMEIQALEQKNKAALEAFFAKERREVGQNRRGSQAAYDYYRNMHRQAGRDSIFVDSKK